MLDLNKSQLKAVNSIDGVIQVAACAGSGKTRVLTYRIANMIKNHNINPENIFVATFTKKAAEEMKERLSKIIERQLVEKLTIGTFHSIGYRILNHEQKIKSGGWGGYNLLKNPNMIINEIIKDLKLSNKYDAKMFYGRIQKYKRELITPEHSMMDLLMNSEITEFDENFIKVYDEYEKRKNKKNLIDFNDMIYGLYYLLFKDEKLLKKYQDKFQYLLIDECQDCNKGQNELIKLLGEPHDNIFVVGDDDQCIYKFRGALPEQFIDLKNEYSNLQQISLEENYRSEPHILKAANNLIKHNKTRIIKELKPQKLLNNKKLNYIMLDNEDIEARYIADKIQTYQDKGKDLNNMSILFRTNSQARALEDALIEKAIPYTIENGISFYNRAEIQDLIAYLKVAVNPNDNVSLKRIINTPNRYLGKAFMNDLETAAKENKCSLYKAINYLKIKRNSYKNVYKFRDTIEYIQNNIEFKRRNNSAGDIIRLIINYTKYDEYLRNQKNEEDNIKVDNILSLVQAGMKYKNVNDFLSYINKVTNPKKYNLGTVKLMTIHKSKGLEFPIVFLAGLSDGLLPHNHSLDNDISIEEERRLAYVGITRAEEDLIMTGLNSYLGKYMGSSRFLSESEVIRNELSEQELQKLEN